MLEAIYGDDLQHDEGESTNATELAAHLAALEVNATEAATIPVRAIGLHASAHHGARPFRLDGVHLECGEMSGELCRIGAFALIVL